MAMSSLEGAQALCKRHAARAGQKPFAWNEREAMLTPKAVKARELQRFQPAICFEPPAGHTDSDKGINEYSEMAAKSKRLNGWRITKGLERAFTTDDRLRSMALSAS